MKTRTWRDISFGMSEKISVKKLLRAAFLLTLPFMNLKAEVDPNYYIYLCFGQSNMEGNAKAETIYVETEGAQGRVWGHVTMKGDRGSGTIHDWDENTLSVTVTRHGSELFAVDQNSRQYVFKLKK